METQRFDDLSRSLASGTSRRRFLRGLIGAAAGAVALADRETGARGTVGLCHKTWAWSTDYRFITLDAGDERRIAAHLEHGDTLNPDFNNDPNHCGACGNACAVPANASVFCSGGGCDFTCNAGYEFNASTGACDPVNPCAGKEFEERCGIRNAGFCLPDADQGGLACVATGLECIGCGSGCPAGQVCISGSDGGCGNIDHCHPLWA